MVGSVDLLNIPSEGAKSSECANKSNTLDQVIAKYEDNIKAKAASGEFPREFEAQELVKTRTTVLVGSDVEAKRRDIREYFHKTFDLYEKLFEVLKDDNSFFLQPDSLRHPLVFYFGHTAVFFINKLRVAKVITDRVDAAIESTCAIGVDEMSWDDWNPKHYNWPSIDSLREYRTKVRQVVDDVIMSSTLELPLTWASPLWIVLMGIEHERIHLETSSVLFRQLPIDQVRPHSIFPVCPKYNASKGESGLVPLGISEAPVNSLIPVTAGTVSMGKSRNHHLYGWDNEYGTHVAPVAAFSASKFIVSNADYLAFMRDGGYTKREYWTTEGWGFVTYKKTGYPIFWIPMRNEAGEIVDYQYRAMASIIPMPWSWPVDVNYLEAKAFCNWKNAKRLEENPDADRNLMIRLPTEEEWFRLREFSTPGSIHCDDEPFWEQAPGNISLAYWASSCPVDMFEHHGSGFYDVIGNVWQHTETPMAPFRGFEVHPAYDDFTVPTFDNMHNIIKGGSFISTGNEATVHARYAFRRHFYQHAGLRYVLGEVDCVPKTEERDHLETDPLVSNAIADHYVPALHGPLASVAALIPSYPLKLAETVREVVAKYGTGFTKDSRILEIGCSVGRTTFELAKDYSSVRGFDASTRFIQIGTLLKQTGEIKFSLPEEGDLTSFHKVDLAELGLTHLRDRVEFIQGDASNIDTSRHNNYDLVILSSNFTKFNGPRKFLENAFKLVREGGLLVMTTTNDWAQSKLATSLWVGGHKDETTGEIVHCDDTLSSILAQHFEQCGTSTDIMFLNRSCARLATVGVNALTVWKRK